MRQHNFKILELLFLSLPLIFSNLINAASNFISMFLLSKIDSNALAAGAIVTSTYGFIVMIIMSVLYSVSIMAGKMKGAGQHREIGSIIFSGIIITLVFGIPVTFIMFHMTYIFELLHQPPKICILAGEYFKGIALGFIPSLMGAVYIQFFMSISRTKTILYLTLVGILINSILSYLFIFGYKSIPVMGMFGGGCAIALTAWILLVITIFLCYFSNKFSEYHLFNRESFKLKYISILLKIGTPISIQYSMEILSFSILTYLMGLIGSNALAAQQIALQCSMVSIMIVMAISQSSSVLVSQAFGRRELSSTMEIGNSALLLGLLFMLVVGIIYWFFPLSLISLYLNIDDVSNENTIKLAEIILSIAAFTQIFDAGRNIAAGLLRGLGDTKSSMWTSIVSCWIIGLPAAIILGFVLHTGVAGIRLGIMIGIFVGCINLICRFFSFNKRMNDEFVFAK